MKSSKEIKDQIEGLEKQLKEAEEMEFKSGFSPGEMEIATLLHDKLCVHNHADGCGWYYDRGDWKETSRIEYGNKARKLLINHSSNTLIDIIREL